MRIAMLLYILKDVYNDVCVSIHVIKCYKWIWKNDEFDLIYINQEAKVIIYRVIIKA